MKLIVAVDKNWGIGRNNDLLFSLPLDMKHFIKTTSGKVVVMGRNTLLSLPGGKPLKNRTNIVLSGTGGIGECADGESKYLKVDSIDTLLDVIKVFPPDDVFVIGGARVYKELLPYCCEAIVTKVDADGKAELFFPDLDNSTHWSLVNESEPVQDGEYEIKFCTYKNHGVK